VALDQVQISLWFKNKILNQVLD